MIFCCGKHPSSFSLTHKCHEWAVCERLEGKKWCRGVLELGRNRENGYKNKGKKHKVGRSEEWGSGSWLRCLVMPNQIWVIFLVAINCCEPFWLFPVMITTSFCLWKAMLWVLDNNTILWAVKLYFKLITHRFLSNLHWKMKSYCIKFTKCNNWLFIIIRNTQEYSFTMI